MTVDLVDHGLKPALDAVERHWREQWRVAQRTKDKDGGKGALIIVGRKDQDKFFSNGEFLCNTRNTQDSRVGTGLDFASVAPNPNFFPSKSIFAPRLLILHRRTSQQHSTHYWPVY